MNKLYQALVLTVGCLAWITLPAIAQEINTMPEPVIAIQNVMWSDDTVVEDSEAILTRLEHGLSMTLNSTGLEPGHVYTVWWIIFNEPDKCSDGVCGFNDVFLMDEGGFILNDDGMRQPNFEGREMAQITNLRATGTIAYEDGTAMFRAHLPIGDLTDDIVFGPGLINPMEAEIHLGMRSHGEAVPELLNEQLFTAWGGCPDPMNRAPCADVQVAIFVPPSS